MPNLFQPTALVGAIAIAMGFSTSVSAQDNTNVVNASLDTLVVTATRSEEKIKDVPARISVIDEKIIEQSPISDLSHLLQREAALNIVQTGGIGQQTSAFIRGTNSTHLLFLKDGASLNTALDGGASIPYIDLSDAAQIEILKGPASVQYGTDAIGGVINVRTAPPKKPQLFVTGEMGENSTYKTVVGADLVENGFYTQIRGQRMESDGTPVTNKDKNRASYDQKGYSAKAGYEQDQYGASVSISENDGTNVYYGGSHDFFNRLINVNGRYDFNSNVSLNTRYSNFKDELTGNSYLSYFNTERNEGDVNLRWKFTEYQNVLIGASINNADVESLSILGQKKDLDSTGYYLQHQYDNDGIHTQAGIRVEDNDQFGTHTVGQLAGRIQIAPLTSVYANVGTAFKAPTGNQLYYFDNSKWGNTTYITIGNLDLKPEKSISYELGIDQELAYGLSTYASIYQTQVKNLIDYVSEFDAVNNISAATYVNRSKAKMTGGEAGLKWKKDDLFLTSEYAYVKAENEETGYELARRPNHTLTLTTGLENLVYGISASIVAKSTSKISNSATSKELPGYATVDLNAYWNVNPNVKIFTNIRNMGDVKYKTASYGGDEYYINGGRLASAGVTFRY
ncbi:MAG: TonB-dependent receptor plug domain-containing protein [Acinetobacter tandoii]|uniref:TonB-dependent receptor plug domain-containing protein n=1 Tax=Acinetobacter tandoii TaxID=202954 RepID=UPI003D6C2911